VVASQKNFFWHLKNGKWFFCAMKRETSFCNIVSNPKMHMCAQYGHIITNYVLILAITLLIWPKSHETSLNENMSAAMVYGKEEITDLFYLPLSFQAFAELEELKEIMAANPITSKWDTWSFCWGSKYTAAKFYNHIHAHIQVSSVYRWIWKSCCTMRIKCFTWLLLSDRLNTRDLLQRRHWKVTDDKHCELCPSRIYEDRVHLFFECNFSVRIWNYLQVDWIQHTDMQTIVATARQRFRKLLFMEIVMLACWNIWLIRNGAIFRAETPSFTRWRDRFIHDISLLQYRIKTKYKQDLLDWVRTLP
jgi:hypothetical protein